MTRKDRILWMIAAGSLGLGVLLLLVGCPAPPLTRQISTAPQANESATIQPLPTATWVLPGPGTLLPSMCTSVEVESHPSDAFRLKILVKNSAGIPAPGAKIFVLFENNNPSSPENGPTQILTDDRGIAELKLTMAQLAIPSGSTLGMLSLHFSTSWNNPKAGTEFLSTCANQDIDLAAPAKIIVTVTLAP